MMDKRGELFVCGTPIGNLDDITFNLIKVLKQVDIVAAEDTRRTLRLLNHLNIKKQLVSYHEHNKLESGKRLMGKLLEGKRVALVSDAGMPGISDPGEHLIALAIQKNIKVSVVSGPTAFVNALLLSGLPAGRFIFEGFLPSVQKDRLKRLSEIKYQKYTLIFYESPHRLLNMLQDIYQVFGDRKVAVAKELTKLHEQVYRANISQAIEYFKHHDIKGEYVVVVEGARQDEKQACFEFDISIQEHVKLYMQRGLTKKDAIKAVAKERHIPKSEVYKQVIDIQL